MKGHDMSNIPYSDIRREFYQRGIELIDLELFMAEHGITVHNVQRKFAQRRGEFKIGKVRVLEDNRRPNESFRSTLEIPNEKYSTAIMNIHALDENCIVIPRLDKYIGAYRFIPFDDIPTIAGRHMLYLRCPTFNIAVSLSLWLQSDTVVREVAKELGKRKRLHAIDKKFLGEIKVPDSILDIDIVKRAVDIDREIEENLVKLDDLVSELESLSRSYT